MAAAFLLIAALAATGAGAGLEASAAADSGEGFDTPPLPAAGAFCSFGLPLNLSMISCVFLQPPSESASAMHARARNPVMWLERRVCLICDEPRTLSALQRDARKRERHADS